MEYLGKSARLLAAAALAALILVPAQAAVAASGSYTMVDLGKLGQKSEAVSINSRSEVVGNFFDPDRGYGAFLSSPSRTGGAMVELPGLPCPDCGMQYAFARAINDQGVIAGEALAPDGVHAVMWIGTTIRDLGMFGANTQVTAMNNRGQVVGYGTTAAGEWHVYLWSARTGAVDISPGVSWARAYDINDRGQVVGECGSTPPNTMACLWQPNGTVVTVAGQNGYGATAMGINNNGTVVGEYGDTARHGVAFRWSAGVLTTLTDPAGYSAIAMDVNDVGTIVGYNYLPSAAGPWVYRNGQLTDLPASPSGTRQGPSMAYEVNRSGVIAGRSGTTDDPWFHAVVWRS